MKTAKKILSVVLALAMLVNVFVISTVALSPDSAVDLYVSTDKEVYSPGDEIVLTVSEQVIEAVGQMTLLGCYSLGYNGNYIRPYSETGIELTDHGFTAIASGYEPGASSVSFWSNDNGNLGIVIPEEYATAYGWTEEISFSVASEEPFDATSAKTDLFTIKMKIAENAPDGEYTIGFNPDSYNNFQGYVTAADTTAYYGVDAPADYGFDATSMFNYGKVTFKVSSATPPTVVKSAGQIKMTATSATTVEDAFQLRIISKITSADWDANFANTAVEGATANYITKVGMVAYTGVAADYNLDDAKAAIAAGATQGNYNYGETDYIKHAEGGDATFGTILKCTHGSDKLQNDPICLGFVTYVDGNNQTQTIYYPETYTAPIVSNYDTIAQSYAGQYFGK